MEINTFRDIESNNKLMNLNVFQEKKEILEIINLKYTFFQSILKLQKFNNKTIQFHQVQVIIQELKYIIILE